MLKSTCFGNITDNRKLRSRKNKTYCDAVSGSKNIRGNTVEDVQKIGKSTLGKKDDKVVRNVSIDLESIYARLAEASSFYEDPPSPPNLCTDTSVVQNSLSSVNISEGLDEDDEVLKILNEFLNTSGEASVSSNVHRNRLDNFIHKKKNVTTTDNRLSGYFCSETIFNLSNRVLTDTEIKVLEERLDFAPIQKKLNEPELKSDFNESCRRMRLKWHLRDESESFSEVPVFNPKSRWQPPQGHPRLEVFLSQVENELFELPKADIKHSNLSREEWDAIRSLADDRSTIIKKADKGSCIVIWSRNDYLMETEKKLSDKKVYQEVIVKTFYLS